MRGPKSALKENKLLSPCSYIVPFKALVCFKWSVCLMAPQHLSGASFFFLPKPTIGQVRLLYAATLFSFLTQLLLPFRVYNIFVQHHNFPLCPSVWFIVFPPLFDNQLFAPPPSVATWNSCEHFCHCMVGRLVPTGLFQAYPSLYSEGESLPSGCFSCDEIPHACLSLGFVGVVNSDVERYFIKVKRNKNRLALVKFDQTDQRQTVIKITTTLLQVKCFYPIFIECCSDKKVNICYVICEPWDLCR